MAQESEMAEREKAHINRLSTKSPKHMTRDNPEGSLQTHSEDKDSWYGTAWMEYFCPTHIRLHCLTQTLEHCTVSSGPTIFLTESMSTFFKDKLIHTELQNCTSHEDILSQLLCSQLLWPWHKSEIKTKFTFCALAWLLIREYNSFIIRKENASSVVYDIISN